MPVLNQKHATHCWVHFYCYEWVSLWFIHADSLKLGVVEVVEMLSRRCIEDVDVEVQCEGMIRMDKRKTKISDSECQVEQSQG